MIKPIANSRTTVTANFAGLVTSQEYAGPSLGSCVLTQSTQNLFDSN